MWLAKLLSALDSLDLQPVSQTHKVDMIRFQRNAITLHVPNLASSYHRDDEYIPRGISGRASRVAHPYIGQAQILPFRTSVHVLISSPRWRWRARPLQSLDPSSLDETCKLLARGDMREACQALPAIQFNRRHRYWGVGVTLISFFT
jgi:hypothetical protein